MRTNTAITRKRRTASIRRRARCRNCGIYEAKRYCPALNTQICPSCCSDIRGTRVECETCRYNFVNITTSREVAAPEPKFHAAFVSDSEAAGMVDLAMAWKNPDGRLKAMFFLLDFWKTGMKDCFVDVDISEAEFQQRCASMGGGAAKKIGLDDAKKFIKRGLYISEAVGTPIPWDYQHWKSLLGDMSHVPNPTGSLYKCARCGAELTEPIIEVMKKHAQLEEAHFYMVCEQCAGEFED